MATELAQPEPATAPRNKSTRRIPDNVRQAIIADIAQGVQQDKIASKLGISRQSVVRINARFKRDAAKHMVEGSDNWRTRLVTKSIKSVERALDDDTDSYKSAHIAVASLKGLGVFTEQSIVGVQVLIDSMPAELREIDVTPDADE